MSGSAPPPIIRVHSTAKAIVAESADAFGLAYETAAVDADVTEFRFAAMGDEKLFALLERIPPDVLVGRAVVGGRPTSV